MVRLDDAELAVLDERRGWQVGGWAGLGHVHPVSPGRQPRRDDVSERNTLGDPTIAPTRSTRL
jgi:hypothetical protein